MIEISSLALSEKYSFTNESILRNLPEHLWKIINEKSTILKLKKKKYTTGILGKEHIFYLVKENEIIGCHELISKETHFCTTACLVDCEIAFIPKKVFHEMLTVDEILYQRLLTNMSHEFGVFIHNSRVLAQHNVRERCAISILRLNKFFNGKKISSGASKEKMGFKISRKDHSSLVGTSVESLVRTLHEFKEEKIIEIKEVTIFILDFNKLLEISNLM